MGPGEDVRGGANVLDLVADIPAIERPMEEDGKGVISSVDFMQIVRMPNKSGACDNRE